MTEITRAKTLHQGQFTRLIKITQATSRYPERDVLVLMLGHQLLYGGKDMMSIPEPIFHKALNFIKCIDHLL